MNLKNLGKTIAVVTFGSFVAAAVNKKAPRPTGTYPTPKRLVLVPASVVALNFGLGWLEKQLGLNEKNTKFPFKD